LPLPVGEGWGEGRTEAAEVTLFGDSCPLTLPLSRGEREQLFLPNIRPVKHRRPGASLVFRGFPVLTHLVGREWSPGDAMHHPASLFFDGRARSREHHLSVFDAAGELQQPRVIVHPRLVPVSGDRVEDIQTGASASLRGFPVLLKPAPVKDRDDVILAGRLSRGIDHVPVAEPKVELPVGRRSARLRFRRRLLLVFFFGGGEGHGRQKNHCTKNRHAYAQSPHSPTPFPEPFIAGARISAWKPNPPLSPPSKSFGPST